MKKLQVQINSVWYWVFCRNELKQDPIITLYKSKALPSDALDYFQRHFGNHKFRLVKEI